MNNMCGKSKWVLLTLSICLVVGCVGPTRWDATKIAQSDGQLLNSKGKKNQNVDVEAIKYYVKVGDDLEREADFDVSLDLLDEKEPNAIASFIDGKAVITVNLGLIDKIRPTEDEFAALIGHELAHFTLNHLQMSAGRIAVEVLAAAGAVVVGAIIPGGDLLVDLGKKAVTTPHDREKEEAADKLGFEYAIKAGYQGDGAANFWRKMENASKLRKLTIPFLSTHPTDAKRISYLEELAKSNAE